MAQKKPIVNNGGQKEQMQTGDYVDPAVLASGTPTTGYVPTVQGDGTLAYNQKISEDDAFLYTVMF